MLYYTEIVSHSTQNIYLFILSITKAARTAHETFEAQPIRGREHDNSLRFNSAGLGIEERTENCQNMSQIIIILCE